ncbi:MULTISPECIES: DEAD/DEAH box helicase [unclassified Duganella]|uniref:DEAD/DEAH box helicase n=1 Tax=unclassified Duganella TaxID=2636909 RepID=UPI00087EB4EA|nr:MULTISPECIES: DEAD/DEAH box helicase [unclassified Duganella]SDG57593.1 Superfamily II DNA and RNA helicase [Duganella sp. OV458]SDJ80538.1 Superfamily II DNA and RNA helicase [Duganella sp. OV510]
MTFQALGLIDPLLRTLNALGYKQPTPVQKQAIPAVLAGRDVMAAAQTGTGKTAGFALPILHRLTMDGVTAPQCVRALVLVPTRELAEQVYESFRSYGGNLPLRSAVAYGGVDIAPQIAKLRKGLDVLVATPGRLIDLHDQGMISFALLQTLVLDEADRMLDLGFERDLDILLEALPRQRQTLLFSATFSDEIRKLAKGMLKDAVSIQVEAANTAVKTVKQWLVTTDKRRKSELLLHLLNKLGWAQALVFVKTRKGVEALVKTLHEHGVTADSIHGDKTQPARLRALDRFKRKEVRLLVATDVAARGLDIEALPQVVNFDLPTVAEDYIHRIGRTGRAGMEGEAVSLVCADEVDILKEIEALTRQAIPRYEEPGFEADHRVPETSAKGATAPARKGPAPNAAKRSAAAPPVVKPPAAPKTEVRPAGGSASLGTWVPEEKVKSPGRERTSGKGGPADDRASRNAGAQRGGDAPTGNARSGGAGGGSGGGGRRSGGDAPTGNARSDGAGGGGRRVGGPGGSGRRAGDDVSGAPKGAVVVAGGRGAKSQARSAGRAAAQPGGRKSKPGSR